MPPTYSQAKYWILTIPHANYLPYLPDACSYIKGQLELGRGESVVAEPGTTSSGSQQDESLLGSIVAEPQSSSGYLHWQLIIHCKKKTRLRGIRDIFGPWHAEPTRSDAAAEYVWKDETAVPGTRFELGKLPFKRGESKDWDSIKSDAIAGNLDNIPADVFIRCYGSLKRIAADHATAESMERRIRVYWGNTGTGKSRRAWEEAGIDAYPKDPMSKFWEGYRNHEKVVIDEFRGGINISHILRWFDRYPVIIDVKFGSAVLKAKEIWITSNLHPMEWYPDMDLETKRALCRRLEIEQIN